MNLHERLIENIVDLLRSAPQGLVLKHYEYDAPGLCGEIDVHKRFFFKNGLWIFDYEVKSHACPRSVKIAQHQLGKAEDYWKKNPLVKKVESFLVYAERGKPFFQVVPFINKNFFFNNSKRYDLK